MNLNPIAGIIESVGKVAGDLYTTDKERMQLELEGRKLDQAIDMAQIGVNTEEAKSTNWFVAGGRPFILWVCGIALAYASLIEPIARFIAKVSFGYTGEFPVIDTDLTMQLLYGLLGLGGMRTYEKIKGVAR